MKYDTEPIRSCSIDVTEACNLACTYCHRKGTPILMEDFTTKPIEEIKIGDSVIGFLKPGIGKFQKLAISKVIGTQKRLSPVISMETDRGSTFCSSDHKWWNGRHYIPAKEGMKVFSIYDGKIVTPQCSRDYKMGWLCGMFAGDGTNGKYKYENDPRTFYRCRLVVKDSLILDQASLWAKEFGFDMNHFEFSPGFNGIRKYSKGFWNFIHTILYTDEFKRGWIAGFFDAEGGTFHVNLRIHQNEGKYKEILKRYLIDFGFIFKNEKKSVRILGGSKEYIRFFIFFNPVLKRKIGKLIGISLRGRTEIKKVTPIADEEMVYNITTTTGNYFASGFASKNCFTWGKTKRRLGEKTGRGIIDFFFDHADPDADHYEVTFWGGEPLLEFPLIKKLIPYAANKSDKVVFGGTTNGLLLDEEKLKYLGDHKAKMMISWDGVKEVHDQYRVYPSGKGSWDDLAKKIPVIVRLWPDARFRMSLSRGMLPHMAESIEWIYDQGVKWLAFSAVFEEKWNTGEFERLKEEYTKVAEFMNAHQDLHIHHMSDPGGGIWQDYPCGAGRAYVGFSVDGKIYPCHRFNHYGDKNKEVRDKWRIGDIWNGFNEKRQVFLDYPDLRKEQCGECPIYKFCAGGCYAIFSDMCGSIFGIMPHFCEHQKILFEIGAKKVEQRRQPKRHEGKPCVCYNMCYLEGTDEEIYYMDKSSGMSCICYAVAYSGPSGKDVARRLATWDNNGK